MKFLTILKKITHALFALVFIALIGPVAFAAYKVMQSAESLHLALYWSCLVVVITTTLISITWLFLNAVIQLHYMTDD